MSHLLDRLNFFRPKNVGVFADGHGVTTAESREWEDAYRKRWQHDKVVRSTHGVNCTGSCSWKIYVKGGLVTWETQQTDYPRTRPDLPDHEPRGCSRGASYSWYLYSGSRLKYPLVRSHLLKLWREARAALTPVAAWRSIVEDPAKRSSYTSRRGLGDSSAPTGRKSPSSSPPRTPTRSVHGARTGSSASRRSPRCRWSRMRPAPAISHSSAGCACRSTTGTATSRRRALRRGASRPTCRNRPTGTTRASSSCGGRTSPRPARRTPTSSPRPATRGRSRW